MSIATARVERGFSDYNLFGGVGGAYYEYPYYRYRFLRDVDAGSTIHASAMPLGWVRQVIDTNQVLRVHGADVLDDEHPAIPREPILHGPEPCNHSSIED